MRVVAADRASFRGASPNPQALAPAAERAQDKFYAVMLSSDSSRAGLVWRLRANKSGAGGGI
ncbi:protein of unknown function [Hyphomicrobium sp. MC1]|nr:protein of unknown function [Hyphomicrobium sp. MC1]